MADQHTDSGTHRAVALLRGINVGKGNRIAMADLRAVTENAGCTAVATVLASGNVVVTDPRAPAELRQSLESAYSAAFGYDAVVQVLTRDAVAAAVDAYPFETLDEHHDYLVFSDSEEVTARVLRDMTDAVRPGTTEIVAAGPGCVYWRVSRGDSLTSTAAKVTAAREYARHLTTRNLNTLHKILALG
ncbi:DUF1697 domain-containing protein [Dietzia sp. NPDC055877]